MCSVHALAVAKPQAISNRKIIPLHVKILLSTEDEGRRFLCGRSYSLKEEIVRNAIVYNNTSGISN